MKLRKRKKQLFLWLNKDLRSDPKRWKAYQVFFGGRNWNPYGKFTKHRIWECYKFECQRRGVWYDLRATMNEFPFGKKENGVWLPMIEFPNPFYV